jgi:hypothetical protein
MSDVLLASFVGLVAGLAIAGFAVFVYSRKTDRLIAGRLEALAERELESDLDRKELHAD